MKPRQLLKVIETNEAYRLQDAYEQALNLLKLGLEERQKRNGVLMQKLSFADRFQENVDFPQFLPKV